MWDKTRGATLNPGMFPSSRIIIKSLKSTSHEDKPARLIIRLFSFGFASDSLFVKLNQTIHIQWDGNAVLERGGGWWKSVHVLPAFISHQILQKRPRFRYFEWQSSALPVKVLFFRIGRWADWVESTALITCWNCNQSYSALSPVVQDWTFCKPPDWLLPVLRKKKTLSTKIHFYQSSKWKIRQFSRFDFNEIFHQSEALEKYT